MPPLTLWRDFYVPEIFKLLIIFMPKITMITHQIIFHDSFSDKSISSSTSLKGKTDLHKDLSVSHLRHSLSVFLASTLKAYQNFSNTH